MYRISFVFIYDLFLSFYASSYNIYELYIYILPKNFMEKTILLHSYIVQMKFDVDLNVASCSLDIIF